MRLPEDDIIERFSEATGAGEAAMWAAAMTNKAAWLFENTKPDESIAHLRQVVDRLRRRDEPDLRKAVIRALMAQAAYLRELDGLVDSANCYNEVTACYGGNPQAESPEVQEWVGQAFFSKGYLAFVSGDYEAAIAAYLDAIEYLDASSSPTAAQTVAEVLTNSIACSLKAEAWSRARLFVQEFDTRFATTAGPSFDKHRAGVAEARELLRQLP